MRRGRLLLAFVFLAAAAWTAAALVAAGPAAMPNDAAPALVQWLPQESYEGGKQYDARLDLPVRFWRAGLSLAEAFASIRDQTGVEIAFYPRGDENERVRVNLYLNPERPPTLRDLLAQLMWVVDCAFSVYRADDGEPVYYLMSTSIADGAEARLARILEEAQRRQNEEWERDLYQRREKALAKLDELRSAMGLSTKELVERYRGVDDWALLALLDPDRRRQLEFVFDLPEQEYARLCHGGLIRKWEDWTPEQRARLREILGPTRDWWELAPEQRQARGAAGVGEGNWADEAALSVTIGPIDFGYLSIDATEIPPEGEDWSPGGLHTSAPRILLVDRPDGSGWAGLEVRRLLGETVTDEEREAASEAASEARAERWRQEARERLDAQVQAQGGPRRTVAERLATHAVVWEPYANHTLWQVQEAVARLSGMHVVSDCFAQPPRPLLPYDLEDRETGRVSLLRALQMACTGVEVITVFDPELVTYLSWEWGDAGDFLRFRSRARDLWRASMLPLEVEEELDGLLASCLEEQATREDLAESLKVPNDLRRASRLAKRLTDMQLDYGGKLICGDPSHPVEALRTEFRAMVLGALADRELLRALADLSDAQWQRLEQEGVTVGRDLPETDALRWRAGSLERRGPPHRTAELRLRIREVPESEAFRGRGRGGMRGQLGPGASAPGRAREGERLVRVLEWVGGGDVLQVSWVQGTIHVNVEPLAPLLDADEPAAAPSDSRA